MNELINLAVDISKKRGLALILTQDKALQSKTDLIAKLILAGPLFVVSGNEWLPSYSLSRIIRRETTQVKEIMKRFYVVRASTCFRLLDILECIPSKSGLVLVTDFLHTFYDTDIPLHVRLLRLRQCCNELTRLAFYSPIIVTTQEREGEDYKKFIPILTPKVDKAFTLEHEPELIKQPILF